MNLLKLSRYQNARNKTTKMSPNLRTTGKIVAKFPVKTLPNIEGDTNYKAINGLMQLLYARTATLPTPKYGVHHIHIVLVMNMTLYTTLSNLAWVEPNEPRLYHTVPQNATAAH